MGALSRSRCSRVSASRSARTMLRSACLAWRSAAGGSSRLRPGHCRRATRIIARREQAVDVVEIGRDQPADRLLEAKLRQDRGVVGARQSRSALYSSCCALSTSTCVRTPTSWPSLEASTDSRLDATACFKRFDLGQIRVDREERLPHVLRDGATRILVVFFRLALVGDRLAHSRAERAALIDRIVELHADGQRAAVLPDTERAVVLTVVIAPSPPHRSSDIAHSGCGRLP